MFVGAMVLGDNMRRRREHVAELAERAERAERERELLAHQHVQDERTRIARELHDVVAHSVSLMVIQAAAARRQLAVDPQQCRRRARDGGGHRPRGDDTRCAACSACCATRTERAGLAPQPSLAELDELVAAAADLPVRGACRGRPAGLPSGVEVSAYRIVQEALTNVRRHAGPVHHVDVSVAGGDAR